MKYLCLHYNNVSIYLISRSTFDYILELPLCICILSILFGLASFDDEIIQSSYSWCRPGSKTRSVSCRLRSKEAIRENADANVSFFSKCIRPDCIDWPHERKYKPRNETFIVLSIMSYQQYHWYVKIYIQRFEICRIHDKTRLNA